MNKKQVMDYVMHDGGICPNCGSDNLTGGSPSIEGDKVYLPVTCGDCSTEWDDVYILAGVTDKQGEEILVKE